MVPETAETRPNKSSQKQQKAHSRVEGWQERLKRKIELLTMAKTTKKRPGRPREHQDKQARMKAWRQKQEGRRLDGYVNSNASWRLQKLADAWGCSIAGAVERLVIEADEKYSNVLFPESE